VAETTPQPSKAHLLRELYFNRTGLLLLLTILIAIGLFATSARTHGSASTFWLTLATGILATAGYAAISVFMTTRQFDNFLRTTIENSIEHHISTAASDLLGTIHRQQHAYVPIMTYPPTDHPDTIFNRDLNKSFTSSQQYFFQGITARYSMGRLAALPVAFDQIRIVVADPTKPDSVVARAKHEVDDGKSRERLTRAKDELVDDIWMSIVAAYLARMKSDRIEFCLLADPPIDRVEIFDRDIFLTRYSDPASVGFKFPSSCRFPRGSMAYQMHTKDTARLFTSPYTVKFEIPRNDNPTRLLEVLNDVGLSLNMERYSRLANDFLEFKSGLPTEIAG
jgi:hypothetical protein